MASRKLRGLGVLLSGLLGVSCTPGAISSEMAQTPDIPDQEQCDPENLASVMSPLVMEWPTSARADVESALQDGVVVVSYTCEGVKVLQDCSVPGDYGYRAVTPKTDNALIEGKDNIRASFGGGLWSVDANMDREAKLDLSYRLVGKRKTIRSSVMQSDLEGGEDFCKGATHFVKRVDLGAWTMVAGKDVKAGVAADIMMQKVAVGSSSKELRTKKDGTPGSCDGATRDDSAPPGGCGALIRVTLAPIKGALTKADNVATKGAEEEVGCPKGFTAADSGICLKGSASAKATVCTSGDEAGCAKQCKAGSNESCNRFANVLIYSMQDAGGDAIQKQAGKVIPLMPRLTAACEEDNKPGACNVAAMAILLTAQKEVGDDEAKLMPAVKKAMPLIERACAGGDPRSCSYLRTVYVDDPEAAEKLGYNTKKRYGLMLYNGCASGVAVPCGQLAFEQAIGGFTSRSPEKALKQAMSACLGNHGQACLLAAALQSDGAGCQKLVEGFDTNTVRAFKVREICSEDNLSVIKDDAAAVNKAKARACSLGLSDACK